jgi:hypothetical protein
VVVVQLCQAPPALADALQERTHHVALPHARPMPARHILHQFYHARRVPLDLFM